MSPKQLEMKRRAIKHGMLFIKKGENIRSVSKATGYTKSTVHLDLHRLEEYHHDLYLKVMEKLNFNLAVRHIRGGESNKKKWERKKK